MFVRHTSPSARSYGMFVDSPLAGPPNERGTVFLPSFIVARSFAPLLDSIVAMRMCDY